MANQLLTAAMEESERAIRVLEEVASAIQESWTGPHRKAVHVAMNIALDNFKKELRKCES